MKYRKTFATIAVGLALGVLPATAQASTEMSADCEAQMSMPGHIGVMASTRGGGHIAEMAHAWTGHVGFVASIPGRANAIQS